MFKSDLAYTNSKLNPWLVGFFAGAYPMLFYAGNNYSLVNSWGHFWFFIGFFLILPMLMAKVTGEVIQRFFGVNWRSFWLAFWHADDRVHDSVSDTRKDLDVDFDRSGPSLAPYMCVGVFLRFALGRLF